MPEQEYSPGIWMQGKVLSAEMQEYTLWSGIFLVRSHLENSFDVFRSWVVLLFNIFKFNSDIESETAFRGTKILGNVTFSLTSSVKACVIAVPLRSILMRGEVPS